MSNDRTDEQTTDDQGASQPTEGGGDSTAQGLPASIEEMTSEQRREHTTELIGELEAGSEQVEVLAMQDTENASGEEVA